jgi:hypothetical protein
MVQYVLDLAARHRVQFAVTLGIKPRSRHVRWLQRRGVGGDTGMGLEENKAVVSRFMNEVTTGRTPAPI